MSGHREAHFSERDPQSQEVRGPRELELKRRHPEGRAYAGGPPEEESQDGLAQRQGDDAFDAVVGLVGMLQVSLDQRAPSGRATE